jgi:hypothetical protein
MDTHKNPPLTRFVLWWMTAFQSRRRASVQHRAVEEYRDGNL